MKSLTAKLIIVSSIVLPVLAFLVTTTSPAVACVPEDESSTVCLNWRIHLPTATPTLRPTPVAVATPTPIGDSPTTARAITDTWSSIAPGASIWFKTDYSDGNRNIELWVDSTVQNALGLSILSPDQANSWWNAKPVGRGTFNKGQPEHVLTWVSGYAAPGVWYALLQNYTNSPVTYRLTGNISSAGVKKCVGYWENLALTGERVFWVDCGHYQQIPP